MARRKDSGKDMGMVHVFAFRKEKAMSTKKRESVITSVVLLIIYGFLFCPDIWECPVHRRMFPRMCLILLSVSDRDHAVSGCAENAKDHDAESGVHWKEFAVPLWPLRRSWCMRFCLICSAIFRRPAVMLVGFMIA